MKGLFDIYGYKEADIRYIIWSFHVEDKDGFQAFHGES